MTTTPKPISIPPATMKALSICEPWAYAVASGLKPIENRSQPFNYRGPLLIHASKTKRHLTPDNEQFICDLHPAIFKALDNEKIDLETCMYNRGAIIGIVEMFDCRPLPDIDAAADLFADLTCGPLPEIPPDAWAFGPHCLCFRNARRFRHPVYCDGKLNIWPVPADIALAVKAAMRSIVPWHEPVFVPFAVRAASDRRGNADEQAKLAYTRTLPKPLAAKKKPRR